MPVQMTIRFFRPEAVHARVDAGMASAGEQAGQALADHVRMKLSRPNPLGTTPSAPGEPPARVSGELMDSVAYEVADTGKGVSVMVGAAASYALALEYGTRRMAPRPFLRPALAEMEEEIARIFYGALSF